MAYLGCGLQTEGELAGQPNSSSSSSSGQVVIPECAIDSDCAPPTDCTSYSCKSGKCEVQIKPDDTEVTTGAAIGDCQKNVCKGGKPTVLPDDTDLVPDNDECTIESCSAGIKQTTAAPDGTQCGNGLSCLKGLCEGCNKDPGKCPAPTQCQIVTCPADSCEYTFDVGKVIKDDSQTDCVQDECDANGNVATVGDAAEMPVQTGDICKQEICLASGNVGQMNANQDMMCLASTGICYNDSVCKSGTCTLQPKSNGTAAGDDGTLGNCKALACDGAGNTTVVNNNSDIPADIDPTDCMVQGCMNGNPTMSNKAEGDSCTEVANGKCCSGNCCDSSVGAEYCVTGMCCASGQGCGATCCPNPTDLCDGANNCCGTMLCGTKCCTNADDVCAMGNVCCPAGSKTCGSNCCPNADDNCAGGACCAKANKVCGTNCCTTGHDCNPSSMMQCCPSGQRCNDGVTCCPNGKTCTGQNTCN